MKQKIQKDMCKVWWRCVFTYPLFLISSDKKFGRAGPSVISLEFVDFFHIANSAREIL